jgi:hypothetical protein
MPQKIAKEFLVNNDPARFYAFFLKATQIEKVMEGVRQAEGFRDELRQTTKDCEGRFEDFVGKQYEPAKQAHEDMQEAREVQAQLLQVETERCNRQIQDWKETNEGSAKEKEKAQENKVKALAKLEKFKAEQKLSQDRLQAHQVIELQVDMRKL